MIELPAGVIANDAVQSLVDAGGVMRSPLNTAALRVDRPGSHYMAELSFPPVADAAAARQVVSRLIRAQSEGLRTWFPTVERQSVAGAPVVDGAGQAGRSLSVRGLYQRALVREGWWFSVVDAQGRSYLHNVAAGIVADEDGRVVLPLSEALRAPLPDGATINLVRPMIEGILVGDNRSWRLRIERMVEFSLVIEEAR